MVEKLSGFKLLLPVVVRGMKAGHHIEAVALPDAAIVELEGAEQGKGDVGGFSGS